MRLILLILLLFTHYFAFADGSAVRCENILQSSRLETAVFALQDARDLLALGMPGDKILPALEEFQRQLPRLRSHTQHDLLQSLQLAALERLGLHQGTLERPQTVGRSGDPVYFLRSNGQVRYVVKLYTKSLADMAKELVGMHTFKSARLRLSRTVDVHDLFLLQINGRELPVMIMDLAPGRDMTQTVHQLVLRTIDDSQALTTAAWMGRALAEFHQHFSWAPDQNHIALRITRNYEAEKSRSMINEVTSRIQEMVTENWLNDREASALIEQLQTLISTYTSNSPAELSFIHGDLNAGNILFDPAQRQVTFIDTQLSSNSTGPRDQNGRAQGVGEPMADLGRLMEAIQIEGLEARLTQRQISQMQEALLLSYLSARQMNISAIQTDLSYFRIRFDLQQLIGQIYIREPHVRCHVVHQMLIRFGIRLQSTQAFCN